MCLQLHNLLKLAESKVLSFLPELFGLLYRIWSKCMEMKHTHPKQNNLTNWYVQNARGHKRLHSCAGPVVSWKKKRKSPWDCAKATDSNALNTAPNPWGQPRAFQSAKGVQEFARNHTPRYRHWSSFLASVPFRADVPRSDSNWFCFILKKDLLCPW